MMMEPYDSIIDPLINKMSSEEEKYFNIPADRKVLDLKKIIEIDFKDKNSTSTFGLYQKTKRNLE